MPIFYPPESLQAAVTGPNPTPNLGGAFDALMKMANARQASAQDLLQMLLQSVPETGGQRAKVAGAIAQQPETIQALTPGTAPFVRKRGQPSEHETVTAGFNKALASLPQRPGVDVGQYQTALQRRTEQAQNFKLSHGVEVSPEQINAMALNDAQALPNTAQSVGMEPATFSQFVSATKPPDAIFAKLAEMHPNASESELLALQEKITEAQRQKNPVIDHLNELIKQQALNNLQQQGIIMGNIVSDIKAGGRAATPEEVTKATAAAKQSGTLVTSITGLLPLAESAVKGDKASASKLGLAMSQAAISDPTLLPYVSAAMQGNFNEANLNDLKVRLGIAQKTLKDAQGVMQSGRVPKPTAEGAAAAPTGLSDSEKEILDLLKSLNLTPEEMNQLLAEPGQ